MNFSLHILFVIFCFGIIRSETDSKSNLTLSKPGDHPPKNVGSPKNESVLPTSKKDQCFEKLYSMLGQKSCNLSEEVLDKLRCRLINEITNHVCADEYIIPELESRIKPSSLDCKKNYQWKKPSEPTVFLFITGWNSICENICNREQMKGICEFITYYYGDPKASNESKLHSNNNEGGVKPEKNDVGEDLENEGQNIGIVSSEGEQKPVEETDQKEDTRKSVDSSIKETEKPRKSDSSKDEQALNSVENKHIENPRDDASLASTVKIISPTNIDTEENSHSTLFYFVLVSGMCIAFYFMMYKKKILALMIEGRRRNVKRRPNSAAYSKLDCNLEEAMSSGPSTSSSNTLMY